MRLFGALLSLALLAPADARACPIVLVQSLPAVTYQASPCSQTILSPPPPPAVYYTLPAPATYAPLDVIPVPSPAYLSGYGGYYTYGFYRTGASYGRVIVDVGRGFEIFHRGFERGFRR